MEPPSSIRVSVLNEIGCPIDSGALARAVEAGLHHRRCRTARVCLLLTNDARVQGLNRAFRGVDEPTDVLTFPEGEDASGDIAISVPYASRQAALRNVPLEQELGYLAIHGALHLGGMDDEEEADRLAMMRAMNDVAISIGLPSDEGWTSIAHQESA